MRVACRNHDPGGDRLSMQPSSVAQACLYRVAQSRAEIQQRALAALLVLVGGNDLGFVFARALNRVGERPGVARGERIDILFQPCEKRRIADQAVLRSEERRVGKKW